MKKLLLLAMTFVMMFSFTACSGGSFLSEKDILDVTTNPEVTITLEYDLNDGDGVREVELVFDLFAVFFDKARFSCLIFDVVCIFYGCSRFK